MRDYIQEKEILRRFDEGQSIAYIADDIAMLSRTEAKNKNDSSLRYTKRQAREIVETMIYKRAMEQKRKTDLEESK